MCYCVGMIDPRKVTDFGRSNAKLEEFLLFSIVVAGKGAFQQAQKLEQFLRFHDSDIASPFEKVLSWCHSGRLTELLRACKSPADMDLEIWNSQHLENSLRKNLTSAYTSVNVGHSLVNVSNNRKTYEEKQQKANQHRNS